jgi:hypothetical protein
MAAVIWSKDSGKAAASQTAAGRELIEPHGARW